MAWETAHIEIRPASVGTGIKATLWKRRAPARLRLSVSKAIGDDLGWKSQDMLEVLLGTGEHHGRLRLRKNNSIGKARVEFKQLRNGSYFSVLLGHFHQFVDRSELAAWCVWEKTQEGWIEITLPRWANETKPQAAPAPSPTEHRAPASAKRVVPAAPDRDRTPRSVTASLMGDPEPGRREAVERMSRQETMARVGKIKP